MHITVTQVISSTPSWVWILFILLFIMGIKNSQERPVIFSRMFIAPLIFMAWGLRTITTTFPQLGLTLTSYMIFIIPGFLIGYLLNKRYQSFVRKESVVFKKKSYLPLFIVLLNFIVKYILNVMLIFYHSSVFHIIYSSANGLTVGLFFGSIVYTFYMQCKLKNSISGRRGIN
ncbi:MULTISPECIES: DUF6622 family protein [Paenibacillus]|uniref:DUF1453 domain-containing protein n=1 Tax=Paenibacillus odorifer TaxID=189426 RepID=A0A1R0XD49_9BACL|nr:MULTISPECIES: DUF6622 family protein [Paenibacillus]ETT69046.1 hypothetical protein C171_00695 [Paenibacillus sp. FSL H8-237]OMD33001.1 hypothetical protein BJP51_13665 [Paenibacillus odorifer]OME26291.1 hypothetical protein BSK57_08305 [Paenibacillus odorifer]OME35860.1 hypothetical protein BSK63_05940 [Paenibacillus odorifer]OME40094.1 hypothetical protein BSK58_16785 [Paenibacillus odorifer]